MDYSNQYNSNQYQSSNQYGGVSQYGNASQHGGASQYGSTPQYGGAPRNQNRGPAIPEQYKPLSPWAYMGYNLLFAIPLVGLIMLFIFAFSDKNINRRNYARSFFCNLLLGIILAIIMMGIGVLIFNVAAGSTDTVSQAHYASFVQKFGEFSDEIQLEKASLMAEYGINGEIRNNAQLYYEIAKGKAPTSKYTDTPYGETMDFDFLEDDEMCYEITSLDKISVYSEREVSELNFYGTENDGERYYVTAKGTVFTLPGFAQKQEDGTIRYYVTSQGDYYTE